MQEIPGTNTLNHSVVFLTACTATIQEGRADVDGMHVRVIDTPGFYDTDRKPAEIVAEVVKVSC